MCTRVKNVALGRENYDDDAEYFGMFRNACPQAPPGTMRQYLHFEIQRAEIEYLGPRREDTNVRGRAHHLKLK